MRRVAALACALAVVTWCDGAAAGQGKLTAAHVNAAQRWLDGVVNHVPGQSDQHVAALVSMFASARSLRAANPMMCWAPPS